jgi:hypothetical protein
MAALLFQACEDENFLHQTKFSGLQSIKQIWSKIEIKAKNIGRDKFTYKWLRWTRKNEPEQEQKMQKEKLTWTENINYIEHEVNINI